MTKVLIFGLPRTGTTVLQKHLGKTLCIKSRSEPFTDQKTRIEIGDPYIWVSRLVKSIIKVLAVDLDYINISKLVSAGKFDAVIITQRRNLTDLCVSLYYAEHVANQYHYTEKQDISKIENFICDLEFVNKWIETYWWYIDAINNLHTNSIDYVVFDYDKYIAGDSQTILGTEFCLANEDQYNIDSVSVAIPYRNLCTNYNEVNQLIEANT